MILFFSCSFSFFNCLKIHHWTISFYHKQTQTSIGIINKKTNNALCFLHWNLSSSYLFQAFRIKEAFIKNRLTNRYSMRAVRQVMTTSRAGGLHLPPWGIPHAEPIGSSKNPPLAVIAPLPQMWQSLKSCLPQWGKVAAVGWRMRCY